MSRSLSGKVCLVTGATRGVGKGIALQLGQAGATVYITGRTLKARSGEIGGSLEDTAHEVQSQGGVCVPVQCDHSQESEVEQLFKQIAREQDGRLDVLVNNAYSAVSAIFNSVGKTFWELPTSMWDDVNNVGLRNHYLCSVYATRMMVPRKQGLIVNVSSAGGLRYLFNVAYGVGKAALDRMSADCGHELRKYNIACISLWPGAVQTEIIMAAIGDGRMDAVPVSKKVFLAGESPEYAGKCITHLALDPAIMMKTGRILIASDLGDEYGFTDIDGKQPGNMRSVKFLLQRQGYTTLAVWTPGWLKFPRWVLALAGNKF